MDDKQLQNTITWMTKDCRTTLHGWQTTAEHHYMDEKRLQNTITWMKNDCTTPLYGWQRTAEQHYMDDKQLQNTITWVIKDCRTTLHGWQTTSEHHYMDEKWLRNTIIWMAKDCRTTLHGWQTTAEHHNMDDNGLLNNIIWVTRGLQDTIHQWLQWKWSNFSEVGTHDLVHNWGKTVTKTETTLKINYTFSSVVVKFYKIFASLPCTQHDIQNDNSILPDDPTHKMQIIQNSTAPFIKSRGTIWTWGHRIIKSRGTIWTWGRRIIKSRRTIWTWGRHKFEFSCICAHVASITAARHPTVGQCYCRRPSASQIPSQFLTAGMAQPVEQLSCARNNLGFSSWQEQESFSSSSCLDWLWSQTASYSMGRESPFLSLKRLGHGDDRSRQTTAEVVL